MWVVRVALQRPYSFVVLAFANRDIRRQAVALRAAEGPS